MIDMTNNGKAIFEFTFPDNALNDDHPVFSPPFATSNDTFWQLKFYKADPDNRAYSVLYLIAIPNHEEALTTGTWEKRAKLSVMLYIKSEQYEKFNPIKTDKYSVRSYSWVESNQVNSEIIFSNQVSKELMSTWIGQINNIENANIQLNFNDGFILTHKSILIKRSEYFRKFFHDAKETKEKKRKLDTTTTTATTTTTTTSNTTMNQNFVIINIPDYPRQTFHEVIKFMYTDKIEFNNIIPFEIFKIADYYLIPDLRQKARIEIYKRLHFDNVVKVLFSEGYKWKDLKDDMVDYIVSHFDKIKDTPEYKLLAVDNRGHPAIVVLMQEIIANLFYKKSK
ncbi:BTB/POZ protein [Rhizophagus clarus]|uniref:BTB/POZ protein n=1 Tax=Rhizophagus clarus TaxID=94130 RepID=A0A8H3KTR4_9GLOM|nr:BTB/POZ protein [Rhizophagus clarus]